MTFTCDHCGYEGPPLDDECPRCGGGAPTIAGKDARSPDIETARAAVIEAATQIRTAIRHQVTCARLLEQLCARVDALEVAEGRT